MVERSDDELQKRIVPEPLAAVQLVQPGFDPLTDVLVREIRAVGEQPELAEGYDALADRLIRAHGDRAFGRFGRRSRDVDPGRPDPRNLDEVRWGGGRSAASAAQHTGSGEDQRPQ